MKNNFVQLAITQKKQRTLYCGGLDPHAFGPKQNEEIYGIPKKDETLDFYDGVTGFLTGKSSSVQSGLAAILASVEAFIKRVIKAGVEKCNIRVYKPQFGFYIQFGPAGLFLLSRIREYIKQLERELNIRIICILDCKCGDIATTEAAYFTGYAGNLLDGWGIDYSPFDFDIINVTPWMGQDVMVLGTKDKPGLGLQLMLQGKGIIGVNKTSNPSGPDYQELVINDENRTTVQMKHVKNSASWSREYGLEGDGLSTIGLVVGSTHKCDGSIRAVFPTTTLLVPGFGAQGGKFDKIMLELIPSGEHNGQGAVFSSSRGTMYSFFEKYGGSGKADNLEDDFKKASDKFREKEEEAYNAPEVKDAGIVYPFKKAV